VNSEGRGVLWAKEKEKYGQKDGCLSGFREVNVIQKVGIALEKDASKDGD